MYANLSKQQLTQKIHAIETNYLPYAITQRESRANWLKLCPCIGNYRSLVASEVAIQRYEHLIARYEMALLTK